MLIDHYYLIIKFILTILLLATPLLIHEMGHWALMHKYKCTVSEYWIGLGPVIFRYKKLRVGLFPLGAALVPMNAEYIELTSYQRFFIGLAGPFASLLAYLCFHIMYLCSNAPYAELEQLAYINAAFFAINILPIPPLDGFHCLVEYLSFKNKPLSSTLLRKAMVLGNGLVYGVGFLILSDLFFKTN